MRFLTVLFGSLFVIQAAVAATPPLPPEFANESSRFVDASCSATYSVLAVGSVHSYLRALTPEERQARLAGALDFVRKAVVLEKFQVEIPLTAQTRQAIQASLHSLKNADLITRMAYCEERAHEVLPLFNGTELPVAKKTLNEIISIESDEQSKE